jgi:WD40 repeat protein
LDKLKSYTQVAIFLLAFGANAAEIPRLSPILSVPMSEYVSAVAFAPDQSYFVAADLNGNVGQWSNGKKILSLALNRPISRIAVAPDKQRIVIGTNSGELFLYSSKGRLLKRTSAHKSEIHDILFIQNGSFFVTSGRDANVRIWRKDGVLVRTLSAPGLDYNGKTIAANQVREIAISADGKHILAHGWYEGLSAMIWDFSGKLVARLPSKHYAPFLMSADGRLAVTVNTETPDREMGPDRLDIWDIQSRKSLKTVHFKDGTENIYVLAQSPDGSRFVTGAFEGDITAYDWNGNRLGQTLGSGDGWFWERIAVSPTGKGFLTASGDRSVRLWNWDAQPIAQLADYGDNGAWPLDAAFSSDGKFLLTGDNNSSGNGIGGYLKLWDLGSP